MFDAAPWERPAGLGRGPVRDECGRHLIRFRLWGEARPAPQLAQGAGGLFLHRPELPRLCHLHVGADPLRLRPGLHALGRLEPHRVRRARQLLRLWSDRAFITAFWNTIIYTALAVPLTIVCALGLAMLLNQKLPGRNFFRAAMFFPYVASLVAVAVVWNMLFNPEMGPINMLLYYAGVDPKALPRWAADKNWAMITVVLFGVWKSMGYYMVIYLAGLQGINPDLYEAASIDGANAVQKFRYITIPQLGPTTFFVTVMLTIQSFKVFDQIYLLTQGGPGTSTLVLVYHVYNEAFISWDLGYSSMVALVLFFVVLVITVLQFKFRKEEV